MTGSAARAADATDVNVNASIAPIASDSVALLITLYPLSAAARIAADLP